MTRTRVVIQSRLSSTRLPGKAMLCIAGMPLVELVARRAARSGHDVVVATSAEASDDHIADHLSTIGLRVVRGPLDDVLGRFLLATADLDDDDLVVRLTGDNPMADAGLVTELLDARARSGHRYARVDIDQVPEGLGAEAFDAAGLREAGLRATDGYDREHVTPWLRRHLGELLWAPDGCPADVLAYRATVDSFLDYDRMARLLRDESDPVEVPWRTLMARLVDRVDAAGPRAPRRPGSPPRPSGVVLSAAAFAEPPGGAPADRSAAGARQRELLVAAVERGITHVRVDPAAGEDPERLHAAQHPTVTGRLAVVLAVSQAPGVPGPPTGRLRTELFVERALAGLGGRRVDTLVWPGAEAAKEAWDLALAYRDAGVTLHLGAAVHAPEELDRVLRLDGVDHLELHDATGAWAPAHADRLRALAEAGTVVLLVPGACEAVGALPGWVSSMLAPVTSAAELAAVVAAVSRPG